MPEEIKKENGTNGNNDAKIRGVFLGEGKLLVSVFLAGTGIVFWAVGYFFNPVKNMEKDVALIQQSVANINTNHEVHIQDILEEIKDIRNKDVETDRRLEATQSSIIYLLTIHGVKP